MAKEETKGKATRKIRNLRKQYNKILVGIFEDNAADCIERALDDTAGAFGENIHSIIDAALANLRQCVVDELELEDGGEDSLPCDIEDSNGVALGPGIALSIPGDTTEDTEDLEDGDDETEEEDSEDDEETDEDSV